MYPIGSRTKVSQPFDCYPGDLPKSLFKHLFPVLFGKQMQHIIFDAQVHAQIDWNSI